MTPRLRKSQRRTSRHNLSRAKFTESPVAASITKMGCGKQQSNQRAICASTTRAIPPGILRKSFGKKELDRLNTRAATARTLTDIGSNAQQQLKRAKLTRGL